ncbi:BURP domain-containing protein BNM2A [Trifolium repens]|nr:BURP domain-containing protein BNM2A [Trifolium repens]
MAINIVSCILLHHLLVVIMLCSHGFEARELVETEKKSMEIHHNHHHNHMTHNIDPSFMVFFTWKDLKVGKKMQIYFPKRDPSTSPKLWSKQEAESLPFSSNKLSYLLKFFSFSPNTPQAMAMENTLKECESKPIKGEVKFCATSLESMLEFTQNVLVLLGGENGDKVEAMVVCHMDTSQWSPSHVSFQVLGVTPGSSSVCHFFPADNYIWVPKLKSQGSSSM